MVVQNLDNNYFFIKNARIYLLLMFVCFMLFILIISQFFGKYNQYSHLNQYDIDWSINFYLENYF